jgi:hypothetical protein
MQNLVGVRGGGADVVHNETASSMDSNSNKPFAMYAAAKKLDRNHQHRPEHINCATFETILPFCLDYITVQDRVQCRLVSATWRRIM